MIVTLIYILFIFFSVMTGIAISRPNWPRAVVAFLGMWTGIFMTVSAVLVVLLHG